MKKPVLNRKETCANIARRMAQMNMSISDMAKHIHTSYQAVWKYTSGCSLPTTKHLYAIASILGCKIDDLLAGC